MVCVYCTVPHEQAISSGDTPPSCFIAVLFVNMVQDWVIYCGQVLVSLVLVVVVEVAYFY